MPFLRKLLTFLWLLVPAVIAVPAFGILPLQPPEEAFHLYQQHFKLADELMGNYNFEESIKECEAALQYHPGDYLVHAIMCLDYYEIAEKMDVHKQHAQKVKIYEKMAKIAEEGIKNAPDHGECYFFRGLAHARLSTTNGVIYSLFMAKGIEEDWLKAYRTRSDYVTPNGENLQASTAIALGSYYRLCPSFFLTQLLFGISGNLDKSVDYCRQAYDMDPRIEVTKEYGVSLITRGLDRHNEEDIEQGKVLLAKVKTLPLRLHTDPVDIEHSQLLLNNIQLCPNYSRDQQQEISEKAFVKNQNSVKK